MFVSRNLTGLRFNLSIRFKTSPVLSAMSLNLLQEGESVLKVSFVASCHRLHFIVASAE
jgi:hypothetical protein